MENTYSYNVIHYTLMEYLNMKEPAFEADDLNGFLTGYHCDFAQVPYYNIIFSIQWIIQILTENFKKANGIYFVKKNKCTEMKNFLPFTFYYEIIHFVTHEINDSILKQNIKLGDV